MYNSVYGYFVCFNFLHLSRVLIQSLVNGVLAIMK